MEGACCSAASWRLHGFRRSRFHNGQGVHFVHLGSAVATVNAALQDGGGMAWRDRNTLADRSAAQPPPIIALPGEAPPATGLLRNAIAVSGVMAAVVGQI